MQWEHQVIDAERKAQFIRDGMVRYPQARETVDDFEKFIDESLVAAFEEKGPVWVNFQPSKVSGAFEYGKYIGANERYVARWIAGAIPSRPTSARFWVNLGIYWHPPLKTDVSVVAVSHVTADKGRAASVRDRPDRDRRVLMAPLFKRSERRLFVDLSSVELSAALCLLLDAVDDAVAPEMSGS